MNKLYKNCDPKFNFEFKINTVDFIDYLQYWHFGFI